MLRSNEKVDKKRDPKAIITIYKKDGTSTTHFHSEIDTFGYYEWLEMRDVIQKEKSTYKKYIEDELKQLQPRSTRRRPTLKNETGIRFSTGDVLVAKWKIDLNMLNLRLPDRRPMPSGTYH